MQAYAEGFSLFDASEYELDNAKIAHLWMQGSVVRSWLCELAANAFDQEGNDLARLEPFVEDSGEGRWTVEDSIDKRIPTPVITTSLFERFSRAGRTPSRPRSTRRCETSLAATRSKPPIPSRRLSRTPSSAMATLQEQNPWSRAPERPRST